MTRKNGNKQRKKTYKKQKGGGDADFCEKSSFYPLKNIIQDILDIIFEICYTSSPHNPNNNKIPVRFNTTAIEFVNKVKWNYDKLNGYYWENDIQEGVRRQIFSSSRKNIFFKCLDQDSSIKLSDLSKHIRDVQDLLNFILILLSAFKNYNDQAIINKYAENDLKLLLILVIRIISYLVDDDDSNKLKNIFNVIDEFSNKDIGFVKFGNQIKFPILQKIMDIINNYVTILLEDKKFSKRLNKDLNELASEMKKNKANIGKVICFLQDIGRLPDIAQMHKQIKDFFDYVPSLLTPGVMGTTMMAQTFMFRGNKSNVLKSALCTKDQIPDQDQITNNIVPEFLGSSILTIEQRKLLDKEGNFKAVINKYKETGIGFA